MDVEDGDNNEQNHDHNTIRASPTFIIQDPDVSFLHSCYSLSLFCIISDFLIGQSTSRRRSAESTGSAVREFNAYHQYRQQNQTQANSSYGTTERSADITKHYNPSFEASNSLKDHLARCEHRQRVCFVYFTVCTHLFLSDDLFLGDFLQAVSLPCTLRKKKSDISCHGSNNCYLWAAEIAAKRNSESSTASIVNKCWSTSTKHDQDDIESLLLNEHTNRSESEQLKEPISKTESMSDE